ncbi:MAG: hypothetical protein R2755_04475 [Acidimicrobiales bacterium]
MQAHEGGHGQRLRCRAGHLLGALGGGEGELQLAEIAVHDRDVALDAALGGVIAEAVEELRRLAGQQHALPRLAGLAEQHPGVGQGLRPQRHLTDPLQAAGRLLVLLGRFHDGAGGGEQRRQREMGLRLAGGVAGHLGLQHRFTGGGDLLGGHGSSG